MKDQYTQVKLSDIEKANIVKIGLEKAKFFVNKTGCAVIITNDDGEVHLSISRNDRYPTWDEIKAAKYHFFPDLMMAMYLPPKGEYVNVHPNCFHLYEVKYEKVPKTANPNEFGG